MAAPGENLEIIETRLPGVLVVKPRVHQDPRGFFMETYRQNVLAGAGIKDQFVQDNHSRSSRGVLRGLHYQLRNPQAKLCRVVQGEVLDIAVDVRVGSPTLRQVGECIALGRESLSSSIFRRDSPMASWSSPKPPTFSTNAVTTIDASDDRGVLWNDPEIGIDWQTPSPLAVGEGQTLSSTIADSARPVAAIPTMSLRLLITGATGQIGWHLQRTLAPLGEVTALTRDQLDLSDLDAVTRAVREFEPDILVNAAAYTAVDKAESEPELARTINALAPARMAEELARSGCLLIHYSSDYVFDGNKPTTHSYQENDETGPLNVYGQTKLEGEQLIAAAGCPYIILRTTWVYDTRGKNFLRTVLRLAREKEELRMIADQYGAPTWARTIAEATTIILARSAGAQQRNRGVAEWALPSYRCRADLVGRIRASNP